MITGKSNIGFELGSTNEPTFQAYNPSTGEHLPEVFFSSSTEEVNYAVTKAKNAFGTYKNKSGVEKAIFLDAIGEEILNLGDELIQRACQESGLPEGRITGERGRTVGQLKMFADLLRDGSWVNALIETAIPDRSPIPKSDIRTLSVPVGPVVVFTASNFPLAFSTAGGDTASALAGGNPVIVKAHESHPGTNELVSSAIVKAAQKTGMPDGVFSSLNGVGYALGSTLVQHESIKSVAFTGSYNGGTALLKLASERTIPIPVFAEMGSTNPVVIFPGALKSNATALGAQLAGSIMLGAGQFCTNPGIMVLPEGEDTNQFLVQLSNDITASTAQTMLNRGIQTNYEKNLSSMAAEAGVELIGEGQDNEIPTRGKSCVAKVSASHFLANSKLAEEVFGPSSLAIICEKEDDLVNILKSTEGQLTITAICTEEDVEKFGNIMKEMSSVAGRLIFNGVPTGVEVCHAMQHGGPFPATTDPRFTSVGSEAIKRFVRPLCFQDAPERILPAELQNANPLNIWRKVNGSLTKDEIS